MKKYALIVALAALPAFVLLYAGDKKVEKKIVVPKGKTYVQLDAKNKEMESIGGDQGRLRENMKALRGSAEERSLLQRYTRQLNDQEDRLATLRSELATVKARRDQLQTQLNADIERFVVDEKL